MKVWILIVTVLGAALANAANNDQYCQQKAEQVARELDQVYKNSVDPLKVFGDHAYPKIEAGFAQTNEGGTRHQIVVPHQNSSQQSWINEYEITFDQACNAQVFALKKVSEPVSCPNLHQAKDKLEKYLNAKKDTVPLDDFDWLDENNDESLLTGQKIVDAVASLNFNGFSQSFESETVFDQYCAAGAQCWGGYTVRCDGAISTWLDGED